MATAMSVVLNITDADETYQDHPEYYATMNLSLDGLIWTAGDTVVKDKMTSVPTESELNTAAAVISTTADYTVPLCLFYDYSGDIGGSYYTHEVIGMSLNKRYVFGFSFDGETATEPQLEAWDDSGRDSILKYVLGGSDLSPLEHPEDSMVKAVCTTAALPGASWVGTPIAGSGVTRILKLNNGFGALDVLGSGITSQELYANIKIVIPQNFSYPAVETFLLTVRYSYA